MSEVTTVLFRLLIRKNKYKSILKNLEVKFSRIKIYFIPCKFLEKKKVNIIYIVKKIKFSKEQNYFKVNILKNKDYNT